MPKDGKWVQPGKGPRSFWSGPTSPTSNNATTSASGSSKSGAVYTGGEASNTAPGHLTNAQKHSVYKAWQVRMAEKERKEAAMQARIALNRAVQMAKERGEDAVSALVARMKGWVGGTEEEEAEAAAAAEGLQRRSSTSLEEEGGTPTSATDVGASTCAEATETPADEALMSRVKSELQALIDSAIGAMDEETPSASGSPQASPSSAAQGEYFTSDSNSNAQHPAAAPDEETTPSSTSTSSSLDLPEGFISILVETDVEIPVEVRFHPQAFAHMEMTDEDLARWLARENQAPQRVVSSWELLEGGLGQGKGKGQRVFSAASVEEEEVEQPSPAALQYIDEPDEPEAEPEAQTGDQGEEELLSLEHVSAIGVDVLRAALRSMERHFALTFAASSSAVSPSASEASSSSAGSAATEQASTASPPSSPSSSSSSPPPPPPPPPAAAPSADREQNADSHRGGAPRQAMGFGGRMMYRAQAAQRLREEREEEIRRRERLDILERVEGSGSEELLRRARERAGDGEGSGVE